jgi:CBS domain-containing protein
VRAIDLIAEHPIVDPTTPALDAFRVMAERGLPGIVVRGRGGAPYTVLPASQVLRVCIPEFVRENPALARVYDEKAADHIADKLAGKTVADVMPDGPSVLRRVNADDTLIEVAATMATSHTPLVVVERGDEVLGVITARRLLQALFAEHGPRDSGSRAPGAGDAGSGEEPTA